jgi:peptide/nickel transport system permease protein
MLKQYPTARFILQRGGWYFLTFLVAVAINFALPRLGSNNPVDIIMGKTSAGSSDEAAAVKREAYLKEFGLAKLDDNGELLRDTEGKPVPASMFEQFLNYVSMSLSGDLGTSFQKYPKKVLDVITEAVPWTVALQLPTIVFGWLVGNLLGALAAYRRGMFDRFFFPIALLVSAVPFFVFGMLLLYYFSVVLGWFPAMGGYAGSIVPSFSLDFFGSVAYHYVLPFFSIFLILAGGQAIGMRSMGIYELGTDYIKYAKWLGLKEGRILMYLFRNAMLPQLTGLALSLGTMIGGALITEMIFSYPGLGMAMLSAIQNNDYPMIQGVTLIVTVCVLIANFTVDILIGFLDPRVKAGLQMGGN